MRRSPATIALLLSVGHQFTAYTTASASPSPHAAASFSSSGGTDSLVNLPSRDLTPFDLGSSSSPSNVVDNVAIIDHKKAAELHHHSLPIVPIHRRSPQQGDGEKEKDPKDKEKDVKDIKKDVKDKEKDVKDNEKDVKDKKKDVKDNEKGPKDKEKDVKDKKKKKDNEGEEEDGEEEGEDDGDRDPNELPSFQLLSPVWDEEAKGSLIPVDGSMRVVWKIMNYQEGDVKSLSLLFEKRIQYPVFYNITDSLAPKKEGNFTWNLKDIEDKASWSAGAGSNYILYIYETGTDYTTGKGASIPPMGKKIILYEPSNREGKFNSSARPLASPSSSVSLLLLSSLLFLRFIY